MECRKGLNEYTFKLNEKLRQKIQSPRLSQTLEIFRQVMLHDGQVLFESSEAIVALVTANDEPTCFPPEIFATFRKETEDITWIKTILDCEIRVALHQTDNMYIGMHTMFSSNHRSCNILVNGLLLEDYPEIRLGDINQPISESQPEIELAIGSIHQRLGTLHQSLIKV